MGFTNAKTTILQKTSFACAALLLASTCVADPIKLNNSYTLNISTDKQHITTVEVRYSGKLQESISIGNSMYEQAALKFVRLCQSCERVYVIPVFDATSTYGAQTYVVVYPQDLLSWSIQKLPTSVGIVKTLSGDYYQLSDGINRFEFKQGRLVDVK